MADTNNLSIVDKLVNDEGLKISVSANLAPEIYVKLFITIVAAVFVSIAGGQILKNVLKKT
jgi:hypothetical protein